MKQVMYLLLSILLLFGLTSCSGKNQQNNTVPKTLDVNLSINPEKGEVNQSITFKATVTQGADKVNDADEVIFEVWRSKDKKHKKINIKSSKNGVYILQKEFQYEGTYYIISHVTARGMHTMPKKAFTIGQPSETENPNTNSSNGMKM